MKLNAQIIPQTNSIKYLVSFINNKLRNDTHIESKIKGQAIKVNQLSKLGFKENGISAYTKAFYYKIYIRPYLLYGTETMLINKCDMNRLKRCEGNTIKIALGLPTRIRTTELFYALNIETTQKTIEKLKLRLFTRLMKNDFTTNVIREIFRESKELQVKDSLLNEISSILGNVSLTIKTCIGKCHSRINNIVTTLRKERKENEDILNIKKILTKKDFKNDLIEQLAVF